MKQISDRAELLVGDFQRAVRDFTVSDFIGYVRKQDMELYASTQMKLEDYIADLEAEVEKLKSYRDGYTITREKEEDELL